MAAPNAAIKKLIVFTKCFDEYNRLALTLSDQDKSRRELRYNLSPADLRDLLVQEVIRVISEPLQEGDVVQTLYPDELYSIAIARLKFLRGDGMGLQYMRAISKAEDAKVLNKPLLRI